MHWVVPVVLSLGYVIKHPEFTATFLLAQSICRYPFGQGNSSTSCLVASDRTPFTLTALQAE